MENKSFEDDDNRADSPKQEATNGASDTSLPGKNGSDLALDLSQEESLLADKPYSGMNKEDLLRFSDTSFWNNLRMACFILFWVGWTALLCGVIAMTVTAPRCAEAPTVQWWQSSSFYQVYVRSFYDSDSDGVGDIRGIIEKLDHFTDLNVQGLILSSFYTSHDAIDPVTGQDPDFGYDVIDHTAVDPIYGTIGGVEDLIIAARNMGLKIILEFIPNHTGRQHAWFEASEGAIDTDPTNPYISYYVWEDCTPGGAAPTYPNKWKSIYNAEDGDGVPAWTEKPTSNLCYLHQGLANQPDLNLRSAPVQEELKEILRFWLDKGVDGFRVNSARYLVEDFDLREDELVDDPTCTVSDDETPYECYDHSMTASQTENAVLMSQWRAVIDEYSTADNPKVLLADVNDNVNNTLMYYGRTSQTGSHLVLNYDIITSIQAGCDGFCMAALVDSWIYGKDDHVTTDWMTGHQDEPRLDNPLYTEALLVLKFTLPGSSILHYGEEIGMYNGDVTLSCQDPAGYEGGDKFCRDRSRTPMQWDGSPNGGFNNNDTQPWLPLSANHTIINVETLANSDDEFNIINVFTKMAELQVTSTAFQYGLYEQVIVTTNIFSFLRQSEGTDRYLTSMNLGAVTEEADYSRHGGVPGSASCVATNTGRWSADDNVNLNGLSLQPGEYVVVTWPYSR